MSYSYPPPGGEVPPGAVTQQLPPQDDPWWKNAINAIGGFLDSARRLFHLGSEYPKPLPPPMPFTDAQIASMLGAKPLIRSQLITEIMGQGHLHLFLGYTPTRSQLDESNLLTARFAHWLGDGTGDDLSRGEAAIRTLVLQGMYELAPATSGSGTPGGGGTGSGNLPGGIGDTLEAGVGGLGALAVVAAGLWLGSELGGKGGS